MQGAFTDIIRSSLEWTGAVLFRPFRFKKWVFLSIIAVLAAEFSGCSMNFNFPADGIKHLPANFPKPPWLFPVIILALAIGLILSLLFLWLYSRFSFIFLNSVIRNDASIKTPFKENKSAGNSFFRWNITYLFVILCIFSLVILSLVGGINLLKDIPVILMIILWIFALFAIIITLVLIHIILHDLVLPIMYKEKTGIISGWKILFQILKKEVFNLFKYLLVKLGLRIITAIISGLFIMAVIFALVIQILVLGGILYSISLALPEIIRWGYYIFITIMGVLFLAFTFLAINIVLLPIPVFFRTYSLKFLARIDERYDLFRLTYTGRIS